MRRSISRAAAACACTILAAAASTAGSHASTSEPHPEDPQSPARTVQQWLNAVAVDPTGGAWAVGSTDPRGYFSVDSLIQHWDGSGWDRVFNRQHRLQTVLADAYAPAPDDVWAIGTLGHRDDGLLDEYTLTLHWNGTRWTHVPSPNQSGDYKSDALSSIDGTSSTDAWAVGGYLTYKETEAVSEPIAMHWDGVAWTSSSIPTPDYKNLAAVAALAPDNVWAVGDITPAGYRQTLVEHWDGTGWIRIPSPSPPNTNSVFNDVTAISPNDLWAVGWYIEGPTNFRPLAEHWDGQSWQQVPVAKPPKGIDNSIAAVSGDAADDVWAVIRPGTLEHWDGQQWTRVSLPLHHVLLNGVTAASADDVWVVGESYEHEGARHPVRLHWDGSAWSVT